MDWLLMVRPEKNQQPPGISDNSMKTFILIASIFTLVSCSSKAYPDEKFLIDKQYRNLVAPYKKGDTLVFRNDRGSTDSFLISSIDSIIDNRKGGFMSRRPNKFIVIRYQQIPVDYWKTSRIEMGPNNEHREEVIEDGWFLSLSKYPDNNSTSFHFTFKSRSGCVGPQPISPLLADTLLNKDTRITNYYKIEYCESMSTGPDGITVVYSSVDNGLVAFETRKGEQWVRIK